MTTCGSITNFATFVDCVRNGVLQPLIYLFGALALAYFIAGVLKYVRKGADEKERINGRNMMIYGIIALFVMVSVWGLVNGLISSFPLQTTRPSPPQL